MSTSPPRPRLRSRNHFSTGFPLHIAELVQGTLAEHSHEFFEMVYVRRGRGEHFINGTGFLIRAGDFYVISPGEQHGYAPAPDCEMRIVNLLWMPSLLESLLSDDSLLARAEMNGIRKLAYIGPLLRRSARHKPRFAPRLHLSGRIAYRVETLIDELKREQASAGPGSELLLRNLFCALLVVLSRAHEAQHDTPASRNGARERPAAHGAANEVVANAIEFIEEHHTEAVRVADVAAHTTLSESRLSHLFKTHTGRGVIEYLHEYRIARACSRLLESDQKIQDIAAAAGYNDLRFFHRVFQRYTGCNPRQYRQHFGGTALVT